MPMFVPNVLIPARLPLVVKMMGSVRGVVTRMGVGLELEVANRDNVLIGDSGVGCMSWIVR